MTRLDRYVLREMLVPFIAGTTLIIVMLIGNTLFPLIQQIVQYGIPFLVVAKLVSCNIPMLLVLTLPAGTALASAWAINRMARDSEITAIRMSGVSLRRLFAPIYLVGFAASISSFVIYNGIVPPAQREFQRIQSQMAMYALEASPDVVNNKVFTYQGNTFDIREIDKDPSGDPNKLHLQGVIIFEQTSAQGFPILITAQTADYDYDVWTLHNVVAHDIGPDGFVTTEVSGVTSTLNLKAPLNDLTAADMMSPDQKSLPELGAEMGALTRTGQTDPTISVEYYTRMALPFVCLAFAICAPPLSLRFSKTGAYTGIFLSLVMVWVGWNTLLLTKFLGMSGKLPALIAAWSPDLLFLVLGLYFLIAAE